jgi:alkylhydroperoxidase family enzyme
LDFIRNAGYSDAEIAEIIAHVALNNFSNQFNAVVKTELDLPEVALVA